MDWWGQLATIFAAGVSLLAMGVALWQGKSASGSAVEARRSAEAAEAQAIYAKQSADAALRSAEQEHVRNIQAVNVALSEVMSAIPELGRGVAEQWAEGLIDPIAERIMTQIKSLKFTALTVDADFDKALERAVDHVISCKNDLIAAHRGYSNVIRDGREIEPEVALLVLELEDVRQKLRGALDESRAAIHRA